ncbi:MAG: hypothetical protein ABFD82_23570 [Syntrophaceae bacterium]
MNFWEGYMNWPLDNGWKCPICGGRELTWGLVHARCRCNTCHVEYRMRDDEDNRVDTPICLLKTEYTEPFKKIWTEKQTPVDEVTDDEWEAVFEAEPKKVQEIDR